MLPLIFELLLYSYAPPDTQQVGGEDNAEAPKEEGGTAETRGGEEDKENKTPCELSIQVVKDMIFFVSFEANIRPFLSQVKFFRFLSLLYLSYFSLIPRASLPSSLLPPPPCLYC
jgi:hypothetical protein